MRHFGYVAIASYAVFATAILNVRSDAMLVAIAITFSVVIISSFIYYALKGED